MTRSRDVANIDTILTTKGDIYAASAAYTPARLGVGADGSTILADSSQTTGLRWGNNLGFTAGKNKIINGDFAINQRSFTSITTDSTYGFDRWRGFTGGGGVTYSTEAFTPGAAPVAGYESTNFARLVSTSQTNTSDRSMLQQRIEDVRTFAGETVTVSFWAKAASGTPNIAVDMSQNFGSGGSPSAVVNNIGATKFAITSSWARYSVTISVPSISGKTIGSTANTSALFLSIWASAGSDWNSRTNSLGNQNITLDLWGVQVEAGSVATAFQTATGTLQGELAACQRYYVRFNDSTNSRANIGSAIPYSSTNALALVYLPVTMRVAPTAIEWANLETSDVWAANQTLTTVTLASTYASNKTLGLDIAFGGSYTNYRPYFLRQANNTAGYLGVIAEL